MPAPELEKHWLQKLRRLNPNRQHAKGDGAASYAPHKPLLLLALLDLAGEAALDSRVPLSAGLRLRFNESWSVVLARWKSKPDIRLPFFHLATQGFWKPLRADGAPATDPDSTTAIDLHPDFRLLLDDPVFRGSARHILIQTWFPDAEQLGLYALLGIKPDGGVAATVVEEDAASYRAAGRDARFRVQVVTQYFFTCALTGYQLTTNSGAAIVVAAHIDAFSRSKNNDPDNGLALTPDAHWAFDEHLWTIDEKLRVVVARDAFTDWSPEGRSLTARHGQPLRFHKQARLRPHQDNLARHREVFTTRS
jgi:putative restriction endonuclease